MTLAIQNLLKQMRKAKVDTVVFSYKVINCEFYPQIQERLFENGYQVLNGRKLMGLMSYEILEYILNLQKTKMNSEDIFFLVKKDNTLDLQFLSRFIEDCKTVNIVTDDMERFKRLQDNIYEKENILISVSNNKSKALKRAKYIFNINMDKKDLSKFKVNRDAIIVNFKEPIKYDNNIFNGININYFQIDVPDEYVEQFEKIDELEEFDKGSLYECILIKKIEKERKRSVILSKSDLTKRKNIVVDILKEDGIKIVGLIGNNGKIDEGEIIQKYQKII